MSYLPQRDAWYAQLTASSGFVQKPIRELPGCCSNFAVAFASAVRLPGRIFASRAVNTMRPSSNCRVSSAVSTATVPDVTPAGSAGTRRTTSVAAALSSMRVPVPSIPTPSDRPTRPARTICGKPAGTGSRPSAGQRSTSNRNRPSPAACSVILPHAAALTPPTWAAAAQLSAARTPSPARYASTIARAARITKAAQGRFIRGPRRRGACSRCSPSRAARRRERSRIPPRSPSRRNGSPPGR